MLCQHVSSDVCVCTYTNAVVMLTSERTGLTSAYVSSRLNCTFTAHTHTHTHTYIHVYYTQELESTPY